MCSVIVKVVRIIASRQMIPVSVFHAIPSGEYRDDLYMMFKSPISHATSQGKGNTKRAGNEDDVWKVEDFGIHAFLQ